ncbi:MAG: bifunctional 4-hydroxy-2-oxoglutarate aldolase/2-dehydro-3-deoxy-phosphogluconate aldolase [Anaerohalosphaeraceae bacterium]|nr:bifunctional 4-hydroxy-2-oxoglutarate aldolase/2-dehydro-3-deoxy-phosphogluconate aldolase [Anaerohalosphaeraceae bacterium]
MAQHNRLEVLTAIKQIGLVPIFYNGDFETAKNIICACADGGAKTVELTNRGDRAIDLFKKLAQFRDENRPELILGAGTICDAPTAAMFIAAGADFLVSPSIDEETAILCNKRKIPYIPGCGSVTEIHKAETLGVEICKLFPAMEVGGPSFIKAVKVPQPWTDIMATGGVAPTKENLTEWFNAGTTCVGMGSKLITKESVAAKDWAEITKKVKAVIGIISELKGL